MEGVDCVKGGGDDLFGVREEVCFDYFGILGVGYTLWDWGFVDVGQRDAIAGVVEEFFGEELADEAGRAGDENVHVGVWVGVRRGSIGNGIKLRWRLSL